MTIALLAALAMVVQDIIGVPLTQAQARNRAVLSGVLDTAAWLVAIATTFIAVDSLQGHNTTQKVLVIIFVSIANFIGTWTGTKIGQRFVKVSAPHERLDDHEERLGRLENKSD